MPGRGQVPLEAGAVGEEDVRATHPLDERLRYYRENAIYALVYDLDLLRPGCVLLQAALGGTVPPAVFSDLFDAADWILGPTPGLKLYQVTQPELEIIASKTKRRSE